MYVVCLLSAGAAIAGPTASQLPLQVAAPAGVTDSQLRQIFGEAQAIWGPASVTLNWHRIASDEAPCTAGLFVTIDDPRDRRPARPARLGWIPFVSGTPDREIHLSKTHAEELIRDTPAVSDVTRSTHELLLGRALGRALSHELGHYIFKSKAHTPHGLMRATWSADQLLSADRRTFELSRAERDAAGDILRCRGSARNRFPSPFVT